jgi:hypothetical protein
MKARKTRDEYNIEQFYGRGTGGWEVVCCEESFTEAKQRRKEYRENMPEYPVRIIKRRVKIEGGK